MAKVETLLHAKSGDARMNSNGVRADIRFCGFSAAAVEGMRIQKIETCSHRPGTKTVLMILEPRLYDLPLLRKPA